MYVRANTSTYLMSLLGLLCLTLPAMANEAPVSDKLKERVVTDEKIADLCRASIKHKYDMVDIVDENGSARKVPRCVANYEAMRAVADSYLKQEESAKTEIITVIASCQENPDQTSCLEAGKNLAAKAADLHDNLSHNAETAIELLAGHPSAK
jgi:lysine/ornithine N-monooxygenase